MQLPKAPEARRTFLAMLDEKQQKLLTGIGYDKNACLGGRDGGWYNGPKVTPGPGPSAPQMTPGSKKVGFIHTHPEPPKGYRSDFASEPDLFLLKLPGIDTVFVVPYEYVSDPNQTNTLIGYRADGTHFYQ